MLLAGIMGGSGGRPGNLNADGDSITYGYGLADHVTDGWPYKLAALLADAGLDFTLYNSGVSSQTVADMNADAATEIDARFTPGRRNINILFGVTNDLFFGASEATGRARQTTWYTDRRAAHPSVWLVHFTAIRRAQAGLPGDFETNRLANNAYWRTRVGHEIVACVDVGELDEFLDISNATYVQQEDGGASQIHPTAAGHTAIADAAFAALAPLLGAT